MGGHVRVGEGPPRGRTASPAIWSRTTIALEVEAPPPFVSRGGLKLRAALDAFGVEPVGLVCLDVGSSTGGFTDLLLQRDAGQGLRRGRGPGPAGRGAAARPARGLDGADERPSARAGRAAHAGGPGRRRRLVHLAGPNPAPGGARASGRSGGRIVALVKPQFEAGRKQVRDGVVRDPAIHRQTLETVARYALGIGPAAAQCRCLAPHRPGGEPRVLPRAGGPAG